MTWPSGFPRACGDAASARTERASLRDKGQGRRGTRDRDDEATEDTTTRGGTVDRVTGTLLDVLEPLLPWSLIPLQGTARRQDARPHPSHGSRTSRVRSSRSAGAQPVLPWPSARDQHAHASDKLRITRSIGVGGRGGANAEGPGRRTNRRDLRCEQGQPCSRRGDVSGGPAVPGLPPRVRSRRRVSMPWPSARASTRMRLPPLPALQLKKHVYCEKPLTYNVHEAALDPRGRRPGRMADGVGDGHVSLRLVDLDFPSPSLEGYPVRCPCQSLPTLLSTPPVHLVR